MISVSGGAENQFRISGNYATKDQLHQLHSRKSSRLGKSAAFSHSGMARKSVKSLSNKNVMIGSLSAQSEEYGTVIADAITRVGADGAIVVAPAQGLDDDLVFTEGMGLEVGFVSPMMVKEQETLTNTLSSPRVFVTDEKLTMLEEILPVLEKCLESKEPLLIIAPDITGEALSGLVLNLNRGVLDVCAIKAPGFGDRRRGYLEDIATLTGGTFVTEQLGLSLEQVRMGGMSLETLRPCVPIL